MKRAESAEAVKVDMEDAIPPLIPLPRVSVRDYAAHKGLIKREVINKRGRRGPTGKSETPTPTHRWRKKDSY